MATTSALVAPAALSVARLPAEAVPAGLEARLLELTLPNGEMAKVFRACADAKRRDWTGQVITATLDDKVVGWALRWKAGERRHWCLHLFVEEDHRRRGVASTLVRSARFRLRSDTRLRGFVWDDTSAAFWAATTIPAVHAPDMRR